jgi:hypothetical protein
LFGLFVGADEERPFYDRRLQDEASASDDDLVDEDEPPQPFSGFQKTLMKLRAEGSNGTNSPTDAAAKSATSTAANSPKPDETASKDGETKPEDKDKSEQVSIFFLFVAVIPGK